MRHARRDDGRSAGSGGHAQALEPRSYVNTPVGIDFALLGYGYTQGEVGFGKTLKQSPLYSVQGHLIYEIFPWLWAALDATYYTGRRTTVDGQAEPEPANVRLGMMGRCR